MINIFAMCLSLLLSQTLHHINLDGNLMKRLFFRVNHQLLTFSAAANNFDRKDISGSPTFINNNDGIVTISDCIFHDIVLSSSSESAVLFMSSTISASITRTTITRVNFTSNGLDMYNTNTNQNIKNAGALFFNGVTLKIDKLCTSEVNTFDLDQSFAYISASELCDMNLVAVSACSSNRNTLHVTLSKTVIKYTNISNNFAVKNSVGISIDSPVTSLDIFFCSISENNYNVDFGTNVFSFVNIRPDINTNISFNNVYENSVVFEDDCECLFYCDSDVKISNFIFDQNKYLVFAANEGPEVVKFIVGNSVTDVPMVTVKAYFVQLEVISVQRESTATFPINHYLSANCNYINFTPTKSFTKKGSLDLEILEESLFNKAIKYMTSIVLIASAFLL